MAVGSVTGCKLGRKTLKLRDNGKMAASFLDLKTNNAIRISLSGKRHTEEGEYPKEAFSKLPDEELFKIHNISIDLQPYDLPGKPLITVNCSKCGEKVFDNKHVTIDGEFLC